MQGSILTSIKKNLGIEEDFTEFDPDIIMAINTALNVLTQIGVGPKYGFKIEDSSAVWNDFLSVHDYKERLNMVKTYVTARVRLIFDPPQMSSVIECLKETCREFESRLSYEVDPSDTFDDEEGDENGIHSDASER